MNDGLLPSPNIQLSHNRWAEAPWEKWIMQIRLLHFSQSYFHHFTCWISGAAQLGIASHIGGPGSEIIFNWFFYPICESVQDFCLSLPSSDKACILDYFGETDVDGIPLILIEKLRLNNLWERYILSGRLNFIRHCWNQKHSVDTSYHIGARWNVRLSSC